MNIIDNQTVYALTIDKIAKTVSFKSESNSFQVSIPFCRSYVLNSTQYNSLCQQQSIETLMYDRKLRALRLI